MHAEQDCDKDRKDVKDRVGSKRVNGFFEDISKL